MNKKESDLIDAYLDGNLTPQQGELFQQLLRKDPDARKTLRLRATITESLMDRAAAANAKADRSTGSRSIVPSLRKTRTPFISTGFRVTIPWAIAVTLALMLLASRFAPESQQEAASTDPFLGLIVDASDAEFEPGFGPENVKLHAGAYRLRSGAVHLRLENGTDIVMEAPADFQIVDPFHVSLVRGELRAVVPPAARGFTVVAPGVDYVDLGTEFGIAVDKATGSSELHVFDGLVNATHPDSNALLSSVSEGESVTFSGGSLQPTVDADEERFLATGAIGFLRWQRQRVQLEQDPDLIAYYPFVKSETLINMAVNAVAGDGRIEGAPWVSGRWPGKDALLFDRRTDFVELEIPGEYAAMTFSSWIKLDRLGPYLNSVFNSNGLESGDVHWDIASDGRMMLIRRFSDYRNLLENETLVPVGKWVHIAGTVSTKLQERRVYVNGQLAGYDKSQMGPLTPGLSRIGQWLSSNAVPKRGLKGRIDELAIWKRVLTQHEIAQLTESGKPNKIWPSESR